MEVGMFKNTDKKLIFRLATCLFMVFLTGSIYWGWNGIQELLYISGAFEDACDGKSDITYMKINGKDYIDCGERKSGINNLYTMAFSPHFITSIFTGSIIDNLSPRYCYVFGQIFNAIIWVVITLFPKSPITLNICFFLIGLTAESVYMPLIAVARSFPANNSLVISMLGSCRSLSFMIPTILSAIFKTSFFKPDMLYIIGIGYAVFGNLLCALLGFFLVDKKPEGNNKQEMVENCEDGNLSGIAKILVMIKRALKHRQRFEYLLVVIEASLFLASIEFVNKSQREVLITSDGRSVVDIFKYVNVLTFLPGPILGFVMDKFGPSVALLTLHTAGALYYACAMFDVYFMKLAACFFYFISGSLCISSTYCYINKRFPQRYFGVLVGFVFVFVGSATFTNIPLYNLASKHLKHLAPHNFRPVLGIIFGYCLVCITASSCLFWINRNASAGCNKSLADP